MNAQWQGTCLPREPVKCGGRQGEKDGCHPNLTCKQEAQSLAKASLILKKPYDPRNSDSRLPCSLQGWYTGQTVASCLRAVPPGAAKHQMEHPGQQVCSPASCFPWHLEPGLEHRRDLTKDNSLLAWSLGRAGC